MSGFFFDADSSRRVARMVQAVERQRGDASGDPRRRVGFPQVLPMVCVSQPNIEAIAAGGVWPETILATPLSERFGYRLADLAGNCLPTATDGDGACTELVYPCQKGANLTLELNDGNQYTLAYSGSQPGPVYETWIYTAPGATAWINGGPPNFAGQCFPVLQSPLCTTFYLRSDGTEIPADDYCNTAPFLLTGSQNSPEVCQASFPVVSMKSPTGPFGCQLYYGTVSWNVSVSDPDENIEPADSEPDTPVDDVLTNEATTGRVYRVKPGIFGHGVPLRGHVFCAYYYGGTLYHVGMRNSFLSGFGTGDTNPYTITVETCGNRVPFSWPQVDYGAKEGARLVIGWNQSNRRYEPVGVSC